MLDNDFIIYLLWSTLFKVQKRVHNMIDHMILPID